MRALADFLRRREKPKRVSEKPKPLPSHKSPQRGVMALLAQTRASRALAIGVGCIGGAAGVTALSEHDAEADVLRIKEANIKVHGEVIGGILTIEVEMGNSGLLSPGMKFETIIDLRDHGVDLEIIRKIEGCTYDATFEGDLTDGTFRGERTERSTCPADAAMPVSLDDVLRSVAARRSLFAADGAAAATPEAECAHKSVPSCGCNSACPSPPPRPKVIPTRADELTEDPNTPAEFKLNYRIDARTSQNARFESGYEFVPLQPMPIAGLTWKIIRVDQSDEVIVELTRGEKGKPDFVRYRLQGPVRPCDSELRGTFVRRYPPAHGAVRGPEEFVVGMKVLDAADTATGCNVQLVRKPATPDVLRGRVRCAVLEEGGVLRSRRHVTFWEERGEPGASEEDELPPAQVYGAEVDDDVFTNARGAPIDVTFHAK